MPLALKDPWHQVGGGTLSRQSSLVTTGAAAASAAAATAEAATSKEEKVGGGHKLGHKLCSSLITVALVSFCLHPDTHTFKVVCCTNSGVCDAGINHTHHKK